MMDSFCSYFFSSVNVTIFYVFVNALLLPLKTYVSSSKRRNGARLILNICNQKKKKELLLLRLTCVCIPSLAPYPCSTFGLFHYWPETPWSLLLLVVLLPPPVFFFLPLLRALFTAVFLPSIIILARPVDFLLLSSLFYFFFSFL